MTDLRARTAGPADIPALIALEPHTAADVNRQRFLRRCVNANECYIAERGEEIVAFGILNYSFFEHGFIAAVIVSESVRYSETVIALLRYMEGRCRTPKLFASARGANTPLQNALRKVQFAECGSVQNIGVADEPEFFFYKHLEPDDTKVPEHRFGLG